MKRVTWYDPRWWRPWLTSDEIRIRRGFFLDCVRDDFATFWAWVRGVP